VLEDIMIEQILFNTHFNPDSFQKEKMVVNILKTSLLIFFLPPKKRNTSYCIHSAQIKLFNFNYKENKKKKNMVK